MTDPQDTKKYGWTRDGLRVRYRPRPSILHGLIGSAPWVDIALIMIFVVVVSWHKLTLPGFKLEIPRSSTLGGTERGLVVLVHSYDGDAAREERIIFDNEFFPVDNPERMAVFRDRLGASARTNPDLPLIIEADLNVRHGTIIALCGMAEEARIDVVNLATRSPEGGQQDD